ncbi:hypothetical protein HCN44_009313 [Aphidius gifuensis]|uniref:Uncharacterized protein n=2 Tax=Aphidius gifuensis TaxID=684658 RepID=A0A834Y4G0_APHGI|nr:hypothetical protein HCN44_009313 [Aphidius gifuensis]
MYENTENDNTAWLDPKYLSNIVLDNNNKKINKLRFNKRISKHNRNNNNKNNVLLILFYFLALPLLCSTDLSSSSSDKITTTKTTSTTTTTTTTTTTATTSSTTILQTNNITNNKYNNNKTDTHRLRNGAINIDPKKQEKLQKNKKYNDTHPYKIYNWEVNQINPWLSACDLAGPAPADLLGTCGPPEVPKYCPLPCEYNGISDKIFNDVVQSLDVPIKWRTGSASTVKWKITTSSTKIINNNNNNNNNNSSSGSSTVATIQCLYYLEDSHKRDICQENFGRNNRLSFSTSRENRYWFVSGLRLRHCCELPAINALAPGKGGPLEDVLNGGKKCIDALDKLLIVDALAARLHCEFQEVLARYDCATPYSVIHNCTHCKESYRKWVCSSLVPYFAHGGPSDSLTSDGAYVGLRLRPCLSFCQSVEQRCPYLLPGDRAPAYPTQYAGEPTFLCTDPNIPETGEQAIRGLHGNEDEECCFRVCSEDHPGSGVCANCTKLLPHGHRIGRDPATAPHCDTTTSQNLPPSGSTGKQENNKDGNTVISLSTSSISSKCASGTSKNIPTSSSSSSSSGNKNSPQITISLICLLWIWAALISLCTSQTAFPWSPALDVGFIQSKSSNIMMINNNNKSSKKKISLLTLICYDKKIKIKLTRATHQLRKIIIICIYYDIYSCKEKKLWYRWWCWCAWKNSLFSCCYKFKWYRAKTRINLQYNINNNLNYNSNNINNNYYYYRNDNNDDNSEIDDDDEDDNNKKNWYYYSQEIWKNNSSSKYIILLTTKIYKKWIIKWNLIRKKKRRNKRRHKLL